MDLYGLRKVSAVVLTVSVGLAGCVTAGNSGTDATPEHFSIAANTVDCVGVGPMRCMIVNGQLFYDQIQGYEHVEGKAAEICVLKTKRPEPVPADAGLYQYKQVPC